MLKQKIPYTFLKDFSKLLFQNICIPTRTLLVPEWSITMPHITSSFHTNKKSFHICSLYSDCCVRDCECRRYLGDWDRKWFVKSKWFSWTVRLTDLERIRLELFWPLNGSSSVLLSLSELFSDSDRDFNRDWVGETDNSGHYWILQYNIIERVKVIDVESCSNLL